MLKHRLISGSCLVAATIIMVFVDHWIADVVFLVIGSAGLLFGLTELHGMLNRIDLPGYPLLTKGASLLLVISSLPVVQKNCHEFPVLEVIICAFLFIGFFLVFQEGDFEKGIRKLLSSCGALVYLCLPLWMLCRIYYWNEGAGAGPYLFFWLVLTTKAGDIGGYTLGNITHRLSGGNNHKLVPKISPKKSWEGLLGSILFSAALGYILMRVMGENMHVDGLPVLTALAAPILGAVLAVVGLYGDLAESAFKRGTGVKDSGSTLPGMGGILDVLDSLILAAPLFFIFLKAQS